MLSRREFMKSGITGLVALLIPKPVVRFAEKYLSRLGTVYFVNARTGNDASDGLTVATSKQTIQATLDSLPECPVDIYVLNRDCGELPTPDENGGLEWR